MGCGGNIMSRAFHTPCRSADKDSLPAAYPEFVQWVIFVCYFLETDDLVEDLEGATGTL